MSAVKTGLFEPINLDDLSVDPTDYLEASKALAALAEYARVKGEIVKHRAMGNISLALVLANGLHAIYCDLPEWARW